MKSIKVITHSAAETMQFGERLGSVLRGGEVIECLSDLGGGKTTLVSGLARGFGSHDPVASPSFTLCNTYRAKHNKQMYHFDFYRLSEPGIMHTELAEVIGDESTVTVIEWADIVEDILPSERLVIAISNIDDITRSIAVRVPEAMAYVAKKLSQEGA